MSWVNGYNYQALITFNVHPSSDLSAFPNLVLGTYSQLADVAHGGYVNNTVTLLGQIVPADLIFTSDSAGSVLLSWEIESWNNVTGAIVVWINSDRLATSDTLIYCWVGKASITTYQCTASATWDSNYKGVWHFPSDSADGLKDSTSAIQATWNTGDHSSATGQMDGGVNYTNYNGIDATNDSALQIIGSLTLETWFKHSDGGSARPMYKLASNYGYAMESVGQQYLDFVIGGASLGTLEVMGSTIDDTWHHIVGVYDASGPALKIYLDGVLQSGIVYGTIPTAITDSGTALFLGSEEQYAGGSPNGAYQDEVRVSSIPRSADWIAHEYRQQAQASAWYTVGSWLP